MPPSQGGGGGGGGGSNGSGGTKSGTPTRTPTTDANQRAEVLSYQVTAGPTCAGSGGSSTVRLTWRTKGADEAWIQTVPVAVAAGDPKTSPGSAGPLAANGSVTLQFDCAGENDYYNLGVYNRGNGTHAGVVLQVPRNA